MIGHFSRYRKSDIIDELKIFTKKIVLIKLFFFSKTRKNQLIIHSAWKELQFGTKLIFVAQFVWK